MNIHCKDFAKAFTECCCMNKANREDPADKSGIIPADAYDICNYSAKYNMANFQIQAIMKLDGRLDFDKLVKAVMLSIDAEPVMGCRFVKSDSPYWKPLNDVDKINLCSMEETDNPDEAIQRFLESPMDMDKDSAVKIKLIRSKEYDTLGFKINHACCDAGGARKYILLLPDIYSRINHDDNFVPEPSIRDKKIYERLSNALADKSPEKSWDIMKQIAFPAWNFPWKNMKMGNTRFVFSRLPNGHLDVMNSYAKARGATINDLILTAVYRAMFEISKPPYGIPMDIPVTIDLRRFLPDSNTEAVRSLTSGIVARLARKANEPFEATLSRVMSQTKQIKEGHPDANLLKWGECIEKMNFWHICAYFKAMSQIIDMMSNNPFYVIDKCIPTLSNFGFISKSLIKFGDKTVTDAYIIPPVVRAPGIILVASTYNGIITLGAGYYEPSVRKADMERLINKIRDELVRGCSQ